MRRRSQNIGLLTALLTLILLPLAVIASLVKNYYS